MVGVVVGGKYPFLSGVCSCGGFRAAAIGE